MKQDRKRSSKRKVRLLESKTVQLPLPVLGVLLDAKSAFFELCIETGRSVLMAMQEADREVLCGEKVVTIRSVARYAAVRRRVG